MLFWEPILWYQVDPLFYSLTVDFINLYHLFVLGILLIFVGVCGLFFFSMQFSVIHTLLLFELILLGLNLITIVISYYCVNPIGFLLVYFFLTLAAAESAIGLSLLILFYRIREDTLLVAFNRLFD